MAAKEIYDYISTVSPDNDVTLSTPTPENILLEEGTINQVIHLGDDGSEERISLATSKIFYVTLQWDALEAADSGTIMDFYFDAAKGNGRLESFKWDHPTDGHTYVVRFDSSFIRPNKPPFIHQVKNIRLKILGRIAD